MVTEEKQRSTAVERPGRGTASFHADVLRLARQAASRHGYLAQALGRLADEMASPYAILSARLGAEVVQEEVHRGPSGPQFWRAFVQQFLSHAMGEGKPRAQVLSARQAALRVAMLYVPVASEAESLHGGLALVVGADDVAAGDLLARLVTQTQAVVAAVQLVGSPATGRDGAAPAAQSLARAASAGSLAELAFSITNGLRNKLGCEQVALGMVRRRRVRILSISGLDDVPRRSPGMALIRGAMEECLDAGQPMVAQQDRGWDGEAVRRRYALHEQWRAAAGGDAVLSVPLKQGETCVAVLSLRRRDDEPIGAAQVDEIRKLVEPLTPALEIVHAARRGLLRHAVDEFADAIQDFLRPKRWGRKLLVVLALAFAGWVGLGTLPYEVAAPARVVPAEVRHLAAPFEGVLAASHAVAGDRVRAGDVLCELDRRDLELEQARLRSQQAVLAHQRTRALASGQPVEAQLAEANEQLVQVQLDIVARRIEQTRIRAPVDGVVVRGDLRRSVGAVLAEGTPLFEVAPESGWTLEIEAPEHAVADLADGLSGTFTSQARPESPHEINVLRVLPGAEVRRGRNVFLAEGAIASPDETLRPGAEGVARIRVGPRPVWWLATHRVVSALRLSYWL